jgi:hypothetical protein
VEQILSNWCTEMHHITNDEMVGKFLTYDYGVILQLRDNLLFSLTDARIKENAHLAHVFPNTKKTQFSVLYRHDILQVKPHAFMGNNQFNVFASSAIQQVEYFVPGTKSRFHTLECGFLNHLYYHTIKIRNVCKYNNAWHWANGINLMDYDYIFILQTIIKFIGCSLSLFLLSAGLNAVVQFMTRMASIASL